MKKGSEEFKKQIDEMRSKIPNPSMTREEREVIEEMPSIPKKNNYQEMAVECRSIPRIIQSWYAEELLFCSQWLISYSIVPEFPYFHYFESLEDLIKYCDELKARSYWVPEDLKAYAPSFKPFKSRDRIEGSLKDGFRFFEYLG